MKTSTIKRLQTIVVLGMHRSATSLIAKGLAHEVDMGADLCGPMSDNPEGHWENTHFIKLNDAILEKAGGSWDDPPSREAILAQADKFKKIIKFSIDTQNMNHLPHGLWGWKDPRTTLTIELYEPYLTNPRYVCCFRDVTEVGESLYRRGDMTAAEGETLARVYNTRLLKFLSARY